MRDGAIIVKITPVGDGFEVQDRDDAVWLPPSTTLAEMINCWDELKILHGQDPSYVLPEPERSQP